MPDIDYRAAYCGLFCGACPVFLATETEGGIKAEDGAILACGGCRSERLTPWCAQCSLKACAQKRGLDFCGECAEYPCESFAGFRDTPDFPYHSECPSYLSAIKAEGWKSWIASMERKWRCPDCGRECSWWDQSCPSCKKAMPGFKKPGN